MSVQSSRQPSLVQHLSQTSLSSERGRTEIATAAIVCGTCGTRCPLTNPVCEICMAAPQLKVGDYSFMGAKKTLYDASKGPALSNSIVFLGRAKGPVTETEADDADQEMQIAMKTVPFDSEATSVEMARREIQVFQSLGSRHPSLLPLLFGAETETELVLLTPYAPGGDLYSLTSIAGYGFKCLEEQDASHLASQVLTGLKALHDQRIMHGDIKPHNVFLTKAEGAYVAQLGDFGLSREVPDEKGIPMLGGTPGYMAPEMVGRMEGEVVMVSFGIDLFAMGIMMYELLSSMSPFDPPTNVKAPLEFDEACWEPLADEAQRFVERLLAKAPQDRGTSKEALQHSWLKIAADSERGKERDMCAPRPEEFRFHSMERVWEISGISHEED